MKISQLSFQSNKIIVINELCSLDCKQKKGKKLICVNRGDRLDCSPLNKTCENRLKRTIGLIVLLIES